MTKAQQNIINKVVSIITSEVYRKYKDADPAELSSEMHAIQDYLGNFNINGKEVVYPDKTTWRMDE